MAAACRTHYLANPFTVAAVAESVRLPSIQHSPLLAALRPRLGSQPPRARAIGDSQVHKFCVPSDANFNLRTPESAARGKLRSPGRSTCLVEYQIHIKGVATFLAMSPARRWPQ